MVLKKWLDLHKLKHLSTANLATKPTQKRISRSLKSPPVPASCANNVGQTSSGVTVCAILSSTTKFSDGSAETADSDFLILKMFRRLGARLNAMKGLKDSH